LKGIIVELEKDQAAVLGDDGTVTRVKNRGYRVGETIHMKTKRTQGRRMATMAASLVAVLMVGGMSTWAYATPYSSVSLDGDPSIVLELNRFDKVISYQVDDDEKQTLETDLKNMNINDAVAALIKELKEGDIIDETNFDDIVITVSGKNSERTYKLLASLEKEVSEAAEAEGFDEVNIEAEGTGYEMVQKAREYTDNSENDTVLTPGKLNLITKLYPAKQISEINKDDIDLYANKTVKEIMAKVKEMRTSEAAIKATPAGLEKKTTDAAIQKQNNGRQDGEQEMD